MRKGKEYSISIGTVAHQELQQRASESGRKINLDFADDIIVMGLEVYDSLQSEEFSFANHKRNKKSK